MGTSARRAQAKIESAIADSMNAPGSHAQPSAPSSSVAEWPTVKAETIRTIRRRGRQVRRG